MAQKKKQKPQVAVKAAPVLPALFPWDFRMKCYILLAIGFVFYANSIFNQYALDDSIAIQQNEFVQQGVSGIPKIMTSDSYDSFYRHMGANAKTQYSGGRYRPLSLVTFAIEQSIFGDSPFIRHLVNVMAFLLCIFVVFYFLNDYLLKSLPGGSDIAFLTMVLFTIHPIHTEVVANVKSLDEILSLTLITGTFIFGLKYQEGKNTKHLIYSVVCCFFALFAKEYAITMIVLIPLLFYIVAKKSPVESFMSSLIYYVPIFIYILMRVHAVGAPHHTVANDPLVDPLLYATPIEKLATKCWALGRDIGFLLCPYPLSCDYSFAQIPYYHFSDFSAIYPIFIFGAITLWALIELRKRSILAFVLLFFLACIALISNFLIELGGILGERLLFHCSLAFLIVLSYYILRGLKNVPLQTKRNIVMGTLGVLTIVCATIVWPRNAQWKDDTSLFIHDVSVSTNSCLLNNDAGWCYLGLSESPKNKPEEARAYLDSARKYLYKAVGISKNYVAGFVNLATAYFHLGLPDSAKLYLDKVKALYPNYPSLKKISGLVAGLYINSAMVYGGQKNTRHAITDLKNGISLQPDNPDLWYNLGGAYFTNQQIDSAQYAWNITLKLKPDYADAQRGLQAIAHQQQTTTNPPK